MSKNGSTSTNEMSIVWLIREETARDIQGIKIKSSEGEERFIPRSNRECREQRRQSVS